jgi:hypothetical protein
MNKQEIVKSIENLERSIKSNKQFNKEYKKEITDNKAHNVGYKKEIEGLKVQLEELPVKGWYKSPEHINWLVYFDNGYRYGFLMNGEWNDDFGLTKGLDTGDVPATDSEVEEALIKEAKKFVGKKVVNLHSLETESLNESMVINVFFDSSGTSVWFQEPHVTGVCVMREGKWATIIKDKTVTLNGDYTKV